MAQRGDWERLRATVGGAFLLFCFGSILLEIAEQMKKQGDALRGPRDGLAGKSGIGRPAKAAAAAGASYAERGVPPVLADQLDHLPGFPVGEPTYQPVMILGDKPLQCQCGARAVFVVLEHGEGAQAPEGAPAQEYAFGGFCASCWRKLDQIGKL